jgi:hypothetical protein
MERAARCGRSAASLRRSCAAGDPTSHPEKIRPAHLRMLHRTHTLIAISSTAEGDHGHSILQHDMPDEEKPDCPLAEKRRLKNAEAAHMSCPTHAPVTASEWEAWLCQFLGVPVPALEKLAREKHLRLRPPRHRRDESGDHVHACKKHTGSRKAAHETILDAIEAICPQAGITPERRNIPSMQKAITRWGGGSWCSSTSTSAVTAPWSLTSLSTANSAAIIWPTSAEMARPEMRSLTASWRAPLALRWALQGQL